MRTLKLFQTLAILLLMANTTAYSQSPVQQYVDKSGKEKIQKKILKTNLTDNGFKDGHGKNPYLTSTDQIPDTIALITFYVFDEGTTTSTSAFISTYNLSEAGGNYFANQLHKEAVGKLKEAFRARGVVLLTPDEFLNTEGKKNYYYKQFQPKISKLGKFLSGLESGRSNMAVCADRYRGLDESAAEDFIRAISLGDELARKLGVDAVLSIAIQLTDDGKNISLNQVKWTLNGPNPVPREDKKYIGAAGAGYQEGLVYFSSNHPVGKILLAKRKKKELVDENYEGFGELLSCFADATIERLNAVVNKNSK